MIWWVVSLTSLRMNVKLGGINTIPDPQSVTVLTDPRNPTIVMGNVTFAYVFVQGELTRFMNQVPMSSIPHPAQTAVLRSRPWSETLIPTRRSMLQLAAYRVLAKRSFRT
jgi:hypothetical protein